MNATEIVIREMKIYSSAKILQLPRKGVRQSRESAKLHSDGQVLPFHKAGGDVLGIGVTAADFGYNLRDRSWGVALISVLAIVSVELRKLREVRISRERFFDGLAVEDISVSGQLDAMITDPIPEITHEGLGIRAGSLADQERGNELRIRVHGDENPLIAEVGRIVFSDVSRFLHQERPDFIALDTAAGQLAHLVIHQSLRACASQDKQPHDGVAIESGQPLGTADRAAFQQTFQRLCSGIRVGTHGSKRRLGLRFGKGSATGIAAPALDSALAVGSESLAGLVLASGAGHVISPLEFSGETCDHKLRSEVRVTPRFGLAPTPASTEAGALIVEGYLVRWINGYYHRGTVGSEGDPNRDLHCVPPFPCRSVSLALSGSYLEPKSISLISLGLFPRQLRVMGFPESLKRYRSSGSWGGSSKQIRSQFVKWVSHGVYGFTLRVCLFDDRARFHHALQDHLDRRLCIRVFREIVPKALKLVFDPARAAVHVVISCEEGFSILSCSRRRSASSCFSES
jgi:hypothetical protein